MNLGAFTWVSTWQALDVLLMTSKSLFQPTLLSWALEHISNCLLDITLIAYRHFQLSLSKAVLIILHSQTCSCFFFFFSLKDITIQQDVQTRCPDIIFKFSSPPTSYESSRSLESITVSLKVYFKGSACLHLYTHAHAKPSILIAHYDTFIYPFAPKNWSL